MTNKTWIYLSSTTTTFICLVINALSGIMVARLLGPLGRGELVVIQYYPTLMGSLFCLAMPQALTYFVVREPGRQSQIITAGIHLSIMLGLAGALVFALAAPLGLPKDRQSDLQRAVVIVCLAAPAMVITPHLEAINWGLKRFGWCNSLRIINSLGYCVAITVLWMSGLVTSLAAALAAVLIQTGLLVAHLRRLGFHYVMQRAELAIYRLCFSQGLTFFLPVFAIIVYSASDRFILIKTTTTLEMGYYAIAFAIAYPVSLAVEAFAQVLFVEIADEKKGDFSNSLAVRRFQLAQIIVFSSVVLLMPISPYIINLAFGDKFGPAVPVAFSLIAAMALRGLTRMLDFAMRARNVTRPSTISSIIALGVLIGLSAWWVPLGGVTNFALALLTTELLRFMLMVNAFKREFDITAVELWGLKGNVLKELYHDALTMMQMAQLKRPVQSEATIRQLIMNSVPPSFRLHLYWKRQLVGTSSFSYKDLNRVFAEICDQIDVGRIHALREELMEEYSKFPDKPGKYADYEYWLRLNITRAVKLDLHRRRGLRIFDLGSGPCYFLCVSKYFGHEVFGVDLPKEMLTGIEQKVFTEIPKALGCTSKEMIIQPYEPLCASGTFDLITGFLVCFNNHMRENEWAVPEWEFFIGDVLNHLTSGGRIFLDLNENRNRYGDLLWYDEQLLAFFKSVGNVSLNRVLIQK
jgi:O-antigen/teichoic acid export membrane protein/SAM-dependent methyltransferase